MQQEKVGFADSVETSRVDLTRRTKKFGAKEKARRTKCDATLPPPDEITFHRKIHESGCEDVVEDVFEAADGSKQERVCVAFTLEVDEDFSTMATLFWAEGVWMNMEQRYF